MRAPAPENVYVCANMGENNASARRVVAVCLLVLCAEPRGECGHQIFNLIPKFGKGSLVTYGTAHDGVTFSRR